MTGNRKPHITTIGAGTGQRMVLRALKERPPRITAVCNVTDNGGHTGILRQDYDLPAMGDWRNCFQELIPGNHPVSEAMGYRFSTGNHRGHQVGNLMIAALLSGDRSFTDMALHLKQAFLQDRHTVLPASDQSGQIACRLDNHKELIGEWDIMERTDSSPIKDLYHVPDISSTEAVRSAIENADLLIISPGNLQTGVISCLKTGLIPEWIRAYDVPSVYICNLRTHPGLTPGYTAGDHARTLEEATDLQLDRMLVNEPEEKDRSDPPGKPVRPGKIPEHITVIRDRFGVPAEEVDGEVKTRPVASDMKSRPHPDRHDPDRLRDHLLKMIDEKRVHPS